MFDEVKANIIAETRKESQQSSTAKMETHVRHAKYAYVQSMNTSQIL